MKWFLIILAIVVVLGGAGYGGWLLIQKNDELDKANATVANLNTSLTAAQSQLSNAQGQLASEKARATELQTNLDISMARVIELENEIATINNLLNGSQGDIATEINRLTAQLSAANAELAALKTSTAASLAELTKIKSPHHFYTIEELRDWLERDDTNTNPEYGLLGPADKAFILQVKALRDGFLLPAAVDADTEHIYSWNIAVIGPSIYVVTAETDEATLLANFEMPPAQRPLP